MSHERFPIHRCDILGVDKTFGSPRLGWRCAYKYQKISVTEGRAGESMQENTEIS